MSEEFIRSKFCYTLSPPTWWVKNKADTYIWRPIKESDLKSCYDYPLQDSRERLCDILIARKQDLTFDSPTFLLHSDTPIKKSMWIPFPEHSPDAVLDSSPNVLKFIREYLAVNDTNTFNLLLDWMSSIITDPFYSAMWMPRKPHLVFVCEDLGAVANFWDWFGKKVLHPSHYVPMEISRFVGSANALHMNRLLVVCNTVPTFKNPRKATIENLVGNHRHIIRFKGFKPFEYENCARYVFLAYPTTKFALDNSTIIRLKDGTRRTYEEMTNEMQRDANAAPALFNILKSRNT